MKLCLWLLSFHYLPLSIVFTSTLENHFPSFSLLSLGKSWHSGCQQSEVPHCDEVTLRSCDQHEREQGLQQSPRELLTRQNNSSLESPGVCSGKDGQIHLCGVLLHNV